MGLFYICLTGLIKHKPNYQICCRNIRNKSWWECVELGPPDAIFGLTEAWKKDTNPKKINLGVGAYRDDNGNPFLLPSVKKAENKLSNQKLDHEYAPIAGFAEFSKLAAELVFGKNSYILENKQNATVQTLSGTGALRLIAAFLAKFHTGHKVIYIPNPTWINHQRIFEHSGLESKYYNYYDSKNIALDFSNMTDNICNIPENSIILFHAVAHNPTGIDPNKDQWKEISNICKQRKLFVLFDLAYQGFASGNLNNDVWAVRYFAEEGHKIGIAQSFAKNMGLYGERVGALTLLTETTDETERVISQLKILIRGMYSNPPIYGARIATEILSNKDLRFQWEKDLKEMSSRIKEARIALVDHLKKQGSKKNWNHIIQQIGMFSYTGLTKEQVGQLIKNFSIYLTESGRISIAAVGSKNVEYLATAMHNVTK
ncbi:aspartate aminotransferase, mitochondrial-like [Rhynchophorus ferrugineus]|uniref:Aspartate aminotransferase n=1 Tax=Rhynchophorus ferrugineus TaxID=354439 RepID=A0A834IWC9_RHYFE|nr:hypothetical protein GWI33_005982 [Rhynchophorus ferrugineus]